MDKRDGRREGMQGWKKEERDRWVNEGMEEGKRWTDKIMSGWMDSGKGEIGG